ncbi:MAG: phage major capsid protein [Clostridia bacterium]|nr:phage major capsid protein [Clostridia bacterium]
MNRIKEIEARLAEITEALNEADAEAVAALETETDDLIAERASLMEQAEQRKRLREKIAKESKQEETKVMNTTKTALEERAEKLVADKRLAIDATEVRAQLVSSGTIATPTPVSGIYDAAGAKYSSIIDMVRVEDWSLAGAHEVAYVAADAAAAGALTEGQNAASKEPTFAYITISPTEYACYSEISRKVTKLSPVNYLAKVNEEAFWSLRKAAAGACVAALQSSTICTTVTAALNASDKGVIDATTLRNIVLNYGGSEAVVGEAVLFLNKTDLIAFGDVRGTNEKGAVYEIIPDASNPNTGIIRDGGLAVRYCICSGLTACAGTDQSSSAAIPTMFYGSPDSLELDLFSPYEIEVSTDAGFKALMLAVRGTVMLGAAVVRKDGFVAYTIAKGSA